MAFNLDSQPFVVRKLAAKWTRRLVWLIVRVQELAVRRPKAVRADETIAVMGSCLPLATFRAIIVKRGRAPTAECHCGDAAWNACVAMHTRLVHEILRLLDPLVFVVYHLDSNAPPLYVHRRIGNELAEDSPGWVRWRRRVALLRSPLDTTILEITTRACAECSRLGDDHSLFFCTRCTLTFYCSKPCQRAHWNRGHSVQCARIRAASLSEPDNEFDALIV